MHTPTALIGPLFGSAGTTEEALSAGFRFGARGTHTSRTMMLDELKATLSTVSFGSSKEAYANAIIQANCLSKHTIATRRLTWQRLSELYALDPSVQLFRVLSYIWDHQESSRPLLALLCAIARDPLLAATVPSVLRLDSDQEFLRTPMKESLRAAVNDRLNESVLDKVTRNAASSWTQSGHLVGRTLKRRCLVTATPAAVSFALFLAYKAGFRGVDLFASTWVAILDCSPDRAQQLAFEAKSEGLIDLRMSGDVMEIRLDRLDPIYRRF